MNNMYSKVVGVCALFLLIACERPDSPDFSLVHKVQVPIATKITYQFLGGSESLIDTTAEDYNALFTTATSGSNQGLVSLSKQESFEFGNLDDALPEVDVSPTGIDAEVGEITLTDFSSGGIVGSASFNTVTGLNPGSYPAGVSIPAGNTPAPVNIPFDTDYFERAVIKSGGVELSFTNNLGFTIDQLDLTLNAGANALDSRSINSVADGQTIAWPISFTEGEVLEDLNIDFTASWLAQPMSGTPENLEVNDIAGNALIASEVTAVLDAQEFTSSGTSIVDNSHFSFTSADHYIELRSGKLRLFDIVNQTDLDISNLQISFPDIRTAPYTPADSLVLSIQVPRNSFNGTEETVDLSGVRIYAEGNEVDYHILGTTEDMKAGGLPAGTIKETDNIIATVALDNLEVSVAHGVIAPRSVLLNNDEASNGTGFLDLFNDEEAEVIEIDVLGDLSTEDGGLEFISPVLNILYDSNLDVETTIYAAIAGVNSDGKIEYLAGKSGEYKVSSSFNELQAYGQVLSPDRLIKFNLNRPGSGENTVKGVEVFNKTNTNADVFLNNLPAKIRFIGLARLNESSGEGTVRDPVRFEPGFGMDVPLHFSSNRVSFKDTSETDLGDLPGGEDDQNLTEATVTIGYTNNLPFEMELRLNLLDEQHQSIITVPNLSDEDPITLKGASVDPASKFVVSGEEGNMVLSLNKQQLELLHKTRHMVMDVVFNTKNGGEVKVRAEDSITLSVKMSVALQSNIN